MGLELRDKTLINYTNVNFETLHNCFLEISVLGPFLFEMFIHLNDTMVDIITVYDSHMEVFLVMTVITERIHKHS